MTRLVLEIFIVVSINTIHMLIYLRLKNRNPFVIALMLALISLPWPGIIYLFGPKAPVANPLALFLFIVYGLWIVRKIASDDSYSRIFFGLASTAAFTHMLRIPIYIVLIYGFGMSMQESRDLNLFLYVLAFCAALPFLFRYVRERFRTILDVAETQKWYAVGLPPLCFSILGVAVNGMIASSPETPGVFMAALVTPISIAVYFISMYGFLINKNARMVYQQRLGAAEQLEGTYEFYSRELGEKEKRIRALRHDFRHLVNHLEALAKEGDLDGIMREVRGVAGKGGEIVITPFCENSTVNAVVSFHFAEAEKYGVNCMAEAFVPGALPIRDADLSMLVGNALENCVKAAREMGEGGFVSFEAKPKQGYLRFVFANSYIPGKYVKGEGAGLASIRHLCRQYGGWMDVKDENGEFRVTAFLPVV